MSIEYIKPENAQFDRTEGGFLSLKLGPRKRFDRVHLYRTFPLSEPSRLISVRDEKDNEIGVIDSLEAFEADAIELMQEELDRRYFSPTITKLVSLKEEFGYTYWDAETDAGFVRFTAKGGGTNVTQIDADTLLVIDVDGNRFTFPGFEKADPKFVKIIDTML